MYLSCHEQLAILVTGGLIGFPFIGHCTLVRRQKLTKTPVFELGLFCPLSLRAASAGGYMGPRGSPADGLEFFNEIPLAPKGHYDQPHHLLGTIYQGWKTHGL